MKIGKHGVRDHLRLLLPLFGLIAGVWALRIILSAADSPAWIIRITSVTTATAAAILLAVLLIHLRQFGGYTNVVVAALLLNLWSQVLIVAAIVFSVFSRIKNVYIAPEYSIPGEPDSHFRHIYGHLTFSLGTGILVGAAFGCLLLLILRLFLPSQTSESSWGTKDR